MSRTLFWYIFKDLLRLFMMASGVLAGIMAFCGLLRPMTEHGLDAAQAIRMLMCFMPATQTYSLPIAALFATTVVYGRLSADNELTACRASGIGYLSLTMPALVLGLLLAIVSLLCLCFVVPHYTLKAEKVVFSNLAEVVQKKIQRAHQLKLGPLTVFANGAHVVPSTADAPNRQIVDLDDVVFVRYEGGGDRRTALPSEFWMTRTARAYIQQVGDDVEFSAVIADGSRFPRDFKGGTRATLRQAEFGPIVLPSPIREKAQFMDIQTLKRLKQSPEQARNVQRQLRSLLREEQQMVLLRKLMTELNTRGQVSLETHDGQYMLQRGERPAVMEGVKLDLPGSTRTDDRQVRLVRMGEEPSKADQAKSARVRAEVDAEKGEARLAIDLQDVTLATDNGQVTPRQAYTRDLWLELPEQTASAVRMNPAQYLHHVLEHHDDRRYGSVIGELHELTAKIQTEIHSRASFAISCLILVMVGCVLGMMFRSGNFLTGFALSAVPALLCIALISTGQQVGESSPRMLPLGIALIWSGNAMVLALGLALTWRLHRQ